ncbi:hypothetical protein BLNAU_9880 [Blattamonas nauphoetae]|uniref:Uncharacterized protein n=1 Tax=Blattamonas nauphoetae TaxID=2049346 RepID=A0ABQ9XUI8_9EUKA|nr:hypothetical protein BLNAU_9880 [Blattamonas nauphoetae]
MSSQNKAQWMHPVPAAHVMSVEDQCKSMNLPFATSFLTISWSIVLIILVIIGSLQSFSITAPSELFISFPIICSINALISGYLVFKASQVDEDIPIRAREWKS